MTHAPIDRRTFLGTAALAGAAGLAGGFAPLRALAGEDAPLIESAAAWGYPLVQTGRYLASAHALGFEANRFYLNPKLATPSLKVAGPNVDTIYGLAWLDLAREPVVLEVPDTHDRYYSIQLVDAYENTFDYVGRRKTGTAAGAFLLAAPGWSGKAPSGLRVIHAPTSVVLALTRTLVRGEADAAEAARIQLGYKLAPLSAWPAGARAGTVKDDAVAVIPPLDLSGAGAGFFDELDELVRTYPPTGPEAAAFARFRSLGLGTPAWHARRPADAVLEQALQSTIRRIRASSRAQVVNGWRVNYHIVPFIADPVERAATNIYGPGAHVAEEALYFSAVADADGKPLDGHNRYRLVFPAGALPPAKAFWSLIVYDAEFHLVANPIDRYAITDRTQGVQRGADGSLAILIQRDPPADRANWLPIPDGRFQLLLRTYQPDTSLLDGSYRPPALQAG
jgi:hypothetical protein